MARIRTIKPEFWQDEKLARLGPLDRLVFLGLISQADDAGRLVYSIRMLDGLLFPYTDDSCGESVETLRRLGVVRAYTGPSGQELLQIEGWDKHQKVKNPSQHVLPAPPPEGQGKAKDTESSGDSTENLRSASGDSNPPIRDLGSGILDQGSTTASDEAASEPEPESGPDPAPPPSGPQSIDALGVSLGVTVEEDDTMPTQELVGAWVEHQRHTYGTDPPQAQRGKQGAAAKRLCQTYNRTEIAQAAIGMGQLYPHSQGEPWDLFDLERKFAKAQAAAANHPKIKEQRAVAEFMARTEGMEWQATS